MDEPANRMRAWLPHALLMLLVAAVVVWLAIVIWPLRDALVLAGSVALLTYPILFLPSVRMLTRWWPHWSDEQRRLVAAGSATVLVGLVCVVTVFGGLWLVMGRWEQVWDLLAGLLLGDGRRLDRAIDAVVAKISDLIALYPQLSWDATAVKAAIHEALGRGAVGPDMLAWLFHGTVGVLASMVMTFVALFYLYAQGTQLASMLMRWLPLTPHRREQLAGRFHHLAAFVTAGVVARAAMHGVACGLIAWILAGANPIVTGGVAGFLALLPVVGPALAWLPYASVLWTTGRHLEAACLAAACLCTAWVIELLFRRLARRLGADSLWFGFLLFCCLIGGIATWGLRGVIIGPAAALTAAALFGFLPAIYGVGRDESQSEARNDGS
ncbi:MAG: AI-2E family transporter [Planctomycetota bacterium]